MKDETYCFVNDSKQKKQAATGAFHKPPHSGCRLPSDNLSSAELKAMSGPVDTFNLSVPMPHSKFQRLSKAQQQTQLNVWQSVYGCGTPGFAKLLGVQYGTARSYLVRHSLPLGEANPTEEQTQKLNKTIELYYGNKICPEENPVQNEKIDDLSEKSPEVSPEISQNKIAFSASGSFSAADALRIFNALAVLVDGGDGSYAITVTLG